MKYFLCCIICTMFLQADIRDHLKSAEGKGDLHQMANIDFIYMINLDQRPEKFTKSIRQLHAYGIYPYRFSAVNGWELSLEDVNDVGVQFEPWMPTDLMGTTYLLDQEGQPHHEIMSVPGRSYFCHCLARGAVGIVLSHLSILQDAYDSGYETIWVMEDDVDVRKNPHLISTMIAKLDQIVGKEGWDILFTDRDTRNNQGNYVPCTGYAKRPNAIPSNPYLAMMREDIDPDLRRIGARFGAYSMIVRRSGMKKILDFVYKYKIFLPYDMEWQNIPGLLMTTVREDIVAHLSGALSDNGGPNYKQK